MRWLALVTLMVGCGAERPCDRYVEYMCACHDGEDGISCDELKATYTDASAPVQDECAIDLANQEDSDADAGLVCGGSTTGGTTGS